MKAVILARGMGTRMRREDSAAILNPEQSAAADAGVKAMMPVGRPFLHYVLSALADAGITQVCLVVAPDADAIREHFTREARPTRFTMEFAEQDQPRGTADALLAAESFAGGERFLALNADNYYPVESYRALTALPGAGVAGFDRDVLVLGGNIDAARIRRYALLRVTPDGLLADIVEKPDEGTAAAMGAQALVSMNLWAFTPAIFEACRRVTPSGRGELELPDAVRIAMSELAVPFRVVPIAAPVLDLASRSDISSVASALQGIAVEI
jgi:glucose-1-phosphate thymidylyltransferase